VVEELTTVRRESLNRRLPRRDRPAIAGVIADIEPRGERDEAHLAFHRGKQDHGTMSIDPVAKFHIWRRSSEEATASSARVDEKTLGG
jgi:hypothetical protein